MFTHRPAALIVCLTLFLLLSHAGIPVSAHAGQKKSAEVPETQQEIQADRRAEMEEGIKHLLLSQVEAWNHGQLEKFMAGYWQSPDLTFFSAGSVTKGWAPTLERYRQRYQGEGKEMGNLEFQDLKIDFLSRRGAVVTGSWRLTFHDGKQPHGLFTLIMKKMEGGWRIVHDHTSSAE